MEITLNTNDKILSGVDKIDISFLKCNRENCYTKKAVEERVRDYHSLHFIIYGKGSLKHNDKGYSLKKGQCFMLYAGEKFCYEPDKSDPWSYIWVDFECDNADKLFALCGFSLNMPVLTVKNMDDMCEKLVAMCDVYDCSNMQNTQCTCYLLLILSKLIEDYNSISDDYAGRDIRKFRHIRDAIIFMNNNYKIKISVNDIANSVNISPSYLTAVFAEEIGISPLQYLLMFRIANACRLLQQKELNVSDVAYRVGFGDPLYFSRVFNKFKGIAPGKYAAQGADENPFDFLEKNNIDFR
ncbi:MAG: helix-turn-helix domain-containing protein [Clostridiales bacterium]|nr:helix-turn-helix domain-containing protein [Clostridiales bacterium]